MYGAGMRTVDFVEAAEQARALVNEWTSQQTHERIPEILPPGQRRRGDPAGAGQRAVLQGAVGGPRSRRRRRTPGAFHRADGSSVQAELMTADEGPTYISGPHFARGPPPYAGGTMAMTVALPTGSESAALPELLGSGLAGDGEPAAPPDDAALDLPGRRPT